MDLACALIISGIDLFFPTLTRQVLQKVIPSREISNIWLFIGLMVFLYVVRTALQYVVSYWGHILGVRIEHDMRRDLFSHLQTLSFSFFDKNRTGHIMSRIVNDLAEIAEFVTMVPRIYSYLWLC